MFFFILVYFNWETEKTPKRLSPLGGFVQQVNNGIGLLTPLMNDCLFDSGCINKKCKIVVQNIVCVLRV